MSDKTRIEWTDATWNPVTGCTRVSPGCENCYIDWAPPFRMEDRHFRDGDGNRSHAIGSTTGVRLHPDRLNQPLRWRKPRRVFVNSLSDLFHEDVPDTYIAAVFEVIARAPDHTFQVLTKRHGRMKSLLNSWARDGMVIDSGWLHTGRPLGELRQIAPLWTPPPNVWLGVTVEDQQRADLRIPALLDTPAEVRFLSCEPLLGRVDLRRSIDPGIDWIIVGGESGKDARPMHPDWARSLRDQCQDAGVPFFFKQRGEWTWNEPGQFTVPPKPYTDRTMLMHPGGMTAMSKRNPFDPFAVGHPNWATRITRVGKRAAGRLLDGRTWDQMPTAREGAAS